jgi:hypothetical protein
VTFENLVRDFQSDSFFDVSLRTCKLLCDQNWDKNNPAVCLRTPAFLPSAEDGLPDCDFDTLLDDSVIWATILKRIRLSLKLATRLPSQGMMYSVDFRSSNSDRSSQIASNGYFDRWDLPPWDTWITVTRNHLVFFVPSCAISMVEIGRSANCMGIIHRLTA